MTPDDFREARRKLGLSAQSMAEALGIAEGRTVRRWEAGDRDIPGPAIVLIRIWLDPRCPEWARPAAGGWTIDLERKEMSNPAGIVAPLQRLHDGGYQLAGTLRPSEDNLSQEEAERFYASAARALAQHLGGTTRK